MTPAILVLNAGSSSFKFSLYQTAQDSPLSLVCHGQAEGLLGNPHFLIRGPQNEILLDQQFDQSQRTTHGYFLDTLLDWITQHQSHLKLIGIGHRVVHGGTKYSEPVLINQRILSDLKKLIPLAPLHQPHNLAAIESLSLLDYNNSPIQQVACFDTAFHRTNPPEHEVYFIPESLRSDGIRRYGFHGLSYEFIVDKLSRTRPELATKKLIVAHLGSGASICAISDKKSIATSMGMSALDGIPMGTRPGSFDVGALLYLLREKNYSLPELEDLFYKKSGLLGLSGISNDMRELENSHLPSADFTIQTYAWRIAQMVTSLAVTIQGMDALIFTAGIGENSNKLRDLVTKKLSWLPPFETLVLHTDEELMIAKHTYKVLTKNQSFSVA